ncbi:F-box protein At-B [Punica granatum]|uniref:Uncharacterized protein n=2 Tax=Punica granatum TaxID=22663 RepID=A0A218WAE0_PUNGR|nr:F-box protein At-B [Punica granatum]OWM69181.1 hypothetical protein CDL15_Pgr025368 [Punica granatum]PKI42495.1 hypothetical protein CRG98_037084 [Punica granatum]
MEGCRRRGSGLDSLPSNLLINEILRRLDLPSLCTLSCVSTSLRSAADQALSLLPSLDISEISPDVRTLNHIFSRCRGVDTLTVNCLRLNDLDVDAFLGPHVRELNLFHGALLSPRVLASVTHRCANLRVLMVEMGDCGDRPLWEYLSALLMNCIHLESLCIKTRMIGSSLSSFQWIPMLWSKNVKSLKLHPVYCGEAFSIMQGLSPEPAGISSYQLLSPSSGFTLQKLSLYLDVITDDLIVMITRKLPHLVELSLEDMPVKEPSISHDLTDVGFQSLSSCHHLRSLSLARNRQYCPVSFKRVSNMGIFLFSEGCKGLELIRLSGFSKVSDAGFTSILQSCRNLKKFEIRNAPLLSDLSFHDLAKAPCSLSELRIRSCNLITSETAKKLACYSSLELLDFGGCWSIADLGVSSISSLYGLTTLDLAGADITDTGLSTLGQGTSPIKSLSLRGCKRVTDKGISYLLQDRGIIRNTLSTLDLGHMPGISDLAIHMIVGSSAGITELCIRSCFHVTDSAVEALSKRGSPAIRKLDLHSCTGLSSASIGFLTRPLFKGLWWIGVGATHLSNGRSNLSEIPAERPWLTLCAHGCEMGCHDGWQFHAEGSQSPQYETELGGR